MLRAILFDMGGTLDGDGVHWLNRFSRLYAATGVVVSAARLREAFDYAEARASTDPGIAAANLEQMLRLHVGWQFESLDVSNHGLRDAIVGGFTGAVRRAAAENVPLLASLQGSGLRMGVVSNGCGNVQVLCDDLGYGPYLSLVIDSRQVRIAKPDPAIFACALDHLGLPPADVLMVGDSLERDMLPAKSVGMHTVWLHPSSPAASRPCEGVDARVRTLAELLPLVQRPPWVSP